MKLKRTYSLLTLFLGLVSATVECKNINYSSCLYQDSRKNILKCTDLAQGNLVVTREFHRKCLTEMPASLRTKYIPNKKCPAEDKLYQCLSLNHLQRMKANSHFYYKLDKPRRLRSYCIHRLGHWMNFDKSSRENNLYNPNVKKASCLRFQNDNEYFCESIKVRDEKHLKTFAQHCELNLPKGRYYQLSLNKPCPTKNVKYTCKGEGSNEYLYYKSYDLYTTKQLKANCRIIKNSWKSREQILLNFNDTSMASCETSIGNKVIFCDEMENSGANDFLRFYNSCRVDNINTFFKKNVKCKKEDIQSKCLGNKIFKRNRYLYTKDKGKTNLLKTQCVASGLKWFE